MMDNNDSIEDKLTLSKAAHDVRRHENLSVISANVCGQMKFLEARSQQSEHKTKLQFGASLCG